MLASSISEAILQSCVPGYHKKPNLSKENSNNPMCVFWDSAERLPELWALTALTAEG